MLRLLSKFEEQPGTPLNYVHPHEKYAWINGAFFESQRAARPTIHIQKKTAAQETEEEATARKQKRNAKRAAQETRAAQKRNTKHTHT